jgi:hypothetical protein
MIGSRLRKIAVVAGAGTVAAVTALALNPISASATGTTITLTQPTVSTGHAATFTATLSPFKTPAPGATRATGPITFTITGSDSSTVSCTSPNPAALNKKGKAVCTVGAGSLLASASPYTVTASYGGDPPNFPAASDTVSETVGRASTKITLSDGGTPPASGSGSVFTATVTGGSGSLPTGTVTFGVLATDGKLHKDNCKPDAQPVSASSSTPPVAQATCTLSVGWLKVAKATKNDSNPTTTWEVTARYGGDSTFGPNSTTMRGKASSS